MQTEQLLCWSGMTDAEHITTSYSSNEEEDNTVSTLSVLISFLFGLKVKLKDLEFQFCQFKLE